MTGSGVQDRARFRLAGLVAGGLMIALTTAGEEPDGTGTIMELRTQVRALSEALAATRAENDVLKVRLDRQAYESGGGGGGDWMPGTPGAGETEYRIVDVNKGLGMAVLNAGRRQGVRPGMTFAVMQGDRSVATLRVVDARGAVAGAVIETAVAWRYPKAQDRAIRVAVRRE